MANGILNGKGRWISGGALLLTVVVLIGGWVWSASAGKAQMNQVTADVQDHEGRLRILEKAVSRTDTNILWIREHLERTP